MSARGKFHCTQTGSVQLPRSLAGALVVGGAAFVAAASYANYWQSLSLAQTDEGRLFFGGASLAVDWLGVVSFAVVAGVRFRNGKWGSGLCATVLVVVFGMYSLLNVYGFGVTQRVAPTQIAAERHAALLQATAKAASETERRRREHIEWLQAQVTQATNTASDPEQRRDARVEAERWRQVLRKALDDHAFGAVEVQIAPVATNPDPMAASLAKHLGWEVATVQMVQTLHLGVLLIYGGALAIGVGFAIWPKPRAQQVSLPKTFAKPDPRLPVGAPSACDADALGVQTRLPASEPYSNCAEPSDARPNSLSAPRMKPIAPIPAQGAPAVEASPGRARQNRQRRAKDTRNLPKQATSGAPIDRRAAPAGQQSSRAAAQITSPGAMDRSLRPTTNRSPDQNSIGCSRDRQHTSKVSQLDCGTGHRRSYFTTAVVGHITVAAVLVAGSPYAPPFWVQAVVLAP